MTLQRLAVLEFLEGNTNHPSVRNKNGKESPDCLLLENRRREIAIPTLALRQGRKDTNR